MFRSQSLWMIYLFSFVQNQSAASNEPYDRPWSQWSPWSQWLRLFAFLMSLESDCEQTYLWIWILFASVIVNEPTCDSEVYLHLCVVNISIWTACDAYCELCVMHVMFIWVGYVVHDQTIKTRNIWSLCRVLHSAKRPFAECQGKTTRQSGHVANFCAFWD